MAAEKSLTAQFVDLQLYLVDQPHVTVKGYQFKERLAALEQRLAEACALLERDLHVPTWGMTPEQTTLTLDIMAFLGERKE